MVFAPICTCMKSAKPQTGQVGRSRPSMRVGTSAVPSRGQNAKCAARWITPGSISTLSESVLQIVDGRVRRRIRAVQQRDVKGHVVGEERHLQHLGEQVGPTELEALVLDARAVKQLPRDVEADLRPRVVEVA